eukprot:GHUV01045733.1.p1 GENE.GHUV01045733.1~~GHUV01045733.1.p1  ORF type:complete len:122 (-),score=5.74 GHUV01045733.1:164-529(-)
MHTNCNNIIPCAPSTQWQAHAFCYSGSVATTNSSLPGSCGAAAVPCMLTLQTGEWLRPALMPVTPHVSTAPRPLVLNDPPKTASILSLRTAVTSSRHRFVMAAGQNTVMRHMAAAANEITR